MFDKKRRNFMSPVKWSMVNMLTREEKLFNTYQSYLSSIVVEDSLVEICQFRRSYTAFRWKFECMLAPEHWYSTFWRCCRWAACARVFCETVCLLSDIQFSGRSWPWCWTYPQALFFSTLFSFTSHHLLTYCFLHISGPKTSPNYFLLFY